MGGFGVFGWLAIAVAAGPRGVRFELREATPDDAPRVDAPRPRLSYAAARNQLKSASIHRSAIASKRSPHVCARNDRVGRATQ